MENAELYGTFRFSIKADVPVNIGHQLSFERQTTQTPIEDDRNRFTGSFDRFKSSIRVLPITLSAIPNDC